MGNRFNYFIRMMLFILLMVFSLPFYAQESRIKDLVNIRGNRSNQLIGFGLIIGLANTGDSAASLATNNAVKNLITKLGMAQNITGTVITQSIAGVVMTADLPAFLKNGDRIDVKVSTIGDAKSLAGGTLLPSELRAADGQVYVVAQGAVAVGQANGTGSKVLTVAMVPSGGVVEREFNPELVVAGAINLSLKNPDFTTNARITDKINQHFHGFFAIAKDPSHIEVALPDAYKDNLVGFISDLEGLRVTSDQKAMVVLNERTGTVVMGAEVTISNIAISHGDLTINVAGAKKGTGDSVVGLKGTTVGELVAKLNSLGVKPADLVGIFQAIRAAGALGGELHIM